MDNIITTAPMLDLKQEDLAAVLGELENYHQIYRPLFRNSRAAGKCGVVPARVVESAGTQVGRADLQMVGVDRNAVRSLQCFISLGASEAKMLKQHWNEVAQDLGEDDGVWMTDGSDFPKQGKESVGVKRQYCGQLGKRANCQAGVFVGYASRQGYTLLDRRLFPSQMAHGCGVSATAGVRHPAETTFRTKRAWRWRC